MKQLFSQLLLCFILISCTSEQNQEAVLVSDFEQILSADQENELNNLIIKREQKTTNEIAIVTTPNWENHETILLYVVDFGEKLGVGKKGKDNGVVIVLVRT